MKKSIYSTLFLSFLMMFSIPTKASEDFDLDTHIKLLEEAAEDLCDLADHYFEEDSSNYHVSLRKIASLFYYVDNLHVMISHLKEGMFTPDELQKLHLEFEQFKSMNIQGTINAAAKVVTSFGPYADIVQPICDKIQEYCMASLHELQDVVKMKYAQNFYRFRSKL